MARQFRILGNNNHRALDPKRSFGQLLKNLSKANPNWKNSHQSLNFNQLGKLPRASNSLETPF